MSTSAQSAMHDLTVHTPSFSYCSRLQEQVSNKTSAHATIRHKREETRWQMQKTRWECLKRCLDLRWRRTTRITNGKDGLLLCGGNIQYVPFDDTSSNSTLQRRGRASLWSSRRQQRVWFQVVTLKKASLKNIGEILCRGLMRIVSGY